MTTFDVDCHVMCGMCGQRVSAVAQVHTFGSGEWVLTLHREAFMRHRGEFVMAHLGPFRAVPPVGFSAAGTLPSLN